MAFRRRSSGSWAAVPQAAAEAPAMETRSAAEVYAEACLAARTHLAEGRADEAVASARAALEALPRGMEAQRLLGLALLEAGDPRAAAHAFGASLNADPLDAIALTGLAEAHEQLEGPGAAENFWRRAWEAEPGIPSVGERYQASRRAAGALDVQPGPPPLTRAALARIHLRGGLFEHAAGEARAVLTREPDRADARLTLAEAFWRAGDSEAAAAVAADVLERTPDCVAANLLLAAHWAADGRDASELIARIQAVDPAGGMAARLFDDREVPSLFGTESAFDQWPAAPVAIPPAEEVEAEPVEVVEADMADTRPLEPVAAGDEPAAREAEQPVAVAADVDEVEEVQAEREAVEDEDVIQPVFAVEEDRPVDDAETAAAAHAADDLDAEPAGLAVGDEPAVETEPSERDDEPARAEALNIEVVDALLESPVAAPAMGPIELAIATATEEVEHAAAGAAEVETAETAAEVPVEAAVEEPVGVVPDVSAEERPVLAIPAAVSPMQESAGLALAAAAEAGGSVGRDAGDELMRRGDYLGALREYGAWLRAVREREGGAPSPGPGQR